MINATQLRELVIRPTLQELDLHSIEAEHLLLMTAAHESNLGTYLKQIRGPALGIYQMEPATHDDIWSNFIKYRKQVSTNLRMLGGIQDSPALIYDLRYATAMARIHYLRDPKPIPSMKEYEDFYEYVTALAAYAKRVFNTYEGKATIKDYEQAFLSSFRTEAYKDWSSK